MKIGTITFHFAENYGSMLQAYALQSFLESSGFDVEILNYIYETDYRQYRLFKKHLYNINLKGIKAIFADIIKFPINLKRKMSFNKFKKNFYKMSKIKFKSDIELEKIASDYDAFICGSDQIWNTSCTKGVVPAYFLDFAKNSETKKISYAPSIAHDKIDEEYINEFKDKIQNIDSLSIREKTGVNIIKKISNRDAKQVIDPTLLLTKNDWKKVESVKIPKEKYILVYVLEKNKQIIEYVNSLAKKYNLKIVTFGWSTQGYLKKTKSVYTTGPQEFLTLIKNAEYIVTNSFHATVFSIIYNKKFVTFTTSKSYTRMVDFLNDLELEKRIYNKDFDIEDFIDYEKVSTKLEVKRNEAKQFLFESLNG